MASLTPAAKDALIAKLTQHARKRNKEYLYKVIDKVSGYPRWAGISERSKLFWILRAVLVDDIRKMSKDSLKWSDAMTLRGGFRIQVCMPVFVHAPDDRTHYFVPVTPAETYELANHFGAFPLTAAVADQAHNLATRRLKRPNMDASVANDVFDFPRASGHYLNYGVEKKLVSGGHKIWLLSPQGISINHGFYLDKNSSSPKGYLDPQFSLIQSRGAGHNAEDLWAWDYSQLLQLMRNLTDGQGNSLKLRKALENKEPAVWDGVETGSLTPQQLARLPDA